MPVPVLNNQATQDAYDDALTVEFMYPREGFTVQVYNAAVYYQTAVKDPVTGKGVLWEALEHFLVQSTASFSDTASEGQPAGTRWAGVRFRSAAAGKPARVTVA